MRNKTRFLFLVLLSAAIASARAQSSFRDFTDSVDATMDAVRESREQNAAASDVRAIFARAKAAADEDDKLNLCGFYTGMSAADARTLVSHYALKDGEWSIKGDPVYEIHLSLKGVRRVTKGGNTFDELAQAVANRVGSLKQNWETKDYSLKTIDGISVTMSESSGFTMFDVEAKYAGEREKARKWKGESKNISISDSVAIELRSVPGNLWFGKTEVTQAQWEAVMGGNPSFFKGSDNPVEQVSWYDCEKFLEKLNGLPSVKKSGLTFRLPTEEEWEAACRAFATREYSYCMMADGTEITVATLGQVAWFEDNADGKTHPVGQKKPNAFGLYDMHGNVWEWTSTGNTFNHVYRGGGWHRSDKNIRSSDKDFDDAWHTRESFLGLRLCADRRGNAEEGDGLAHARPDPAVARAVAAVAAASKAAEKATDEFEGETTGADFVRVFSGYTDALAAVDLEGVPDAFRDAFKAHADAFAAVVAEAKKLPADKSLEELGEPPMGLMAAIMKVESSTEALADAADACGADGDAIRDAL